MWNVRARLENKNVNLFPFDEWLSISFIFVLIRVFLHFILQMNVWRNFGVRLFKQAQSKSK